MSSAIYKPKDVFVRPYSRVRHDREEDVCAHWRSKPTSQLTLFN